MCHGLGASPGRIPISSREYVDCAKKFEGRCIKQGRGYGKIKEAQIRPKLRGKRPGLDVRLRNAIMQPSTNISSCKSKGGFQAQNLLGTEGIDSMKEKCRVSGARQHDITWNIRSFLHITHYPIDR